MLLRVFLVFLLFPFAMLGNNLLVSELKVLDGSHLQCTVSWEHAWALEGIRAPYNHDAVWVFIKIRKNGGSWEHLLLGADSADFKISAQQPVQIETAPDHAGFFIRVQKGEGNVLPVSVTIPLQNTLEEGNYEFKAFGIEMAWIREESFYLGDGVCSHSFSRGDKPGTFHINSENAIPAGKDSLSLLDTGMYHPEGTIPLSYPKGYHGFYCMKYEITQKQYTEFLNCLNYPQQEARTAVSPGSERGTGAFVERAANRNGIVISEPGSGPGKPAVYACNSDKDNVFNSGKDGQDRACNFLSWADLSAYLDWAALRPMTELESEKICRGPLIPVEKEFAWGTAFSVDANTVRNDGTENEGVIDSIPAGYGLASYGYAGPQGPLRTGFAAGATTNRLQSGASYYGVMEMSGNVWEQCVTVNTQGLLFDGTPGDGSLDAAGNANIPGWPGADGNGAGYRGGAWLSGVTGEFRDPAVSSRFYAGLAPATRRNTSGGRGVR